MATARCTKHGRVLRGAEVVKGCIKCRDPWWYDGDTTPDPDPCYFGSSEGVDDG